MFNIKKFLNGIKIIPKTPLGSNTQGELEVDSVTGKINYHDGSTRSPAVTESHTATLTNKTIGDSNTINAQTDAFDIQDATDATKRVAFDLAGAATTSTLTIDSDHTTDRTVTFPDADDTLVGKATTDIFTNKTIGDNNTINAQDDAFSIADAADATLRLVFDVQGSTSFDTTLQTSHTADRLLILPDADDTLIGRATTDILTNKTFDALNNNLSNVDTSHLGAGVLDTDLSTVSGIDDTIPSAKAVKDYVDGTAADADAAKKSVRSASLVDIDLGVAADPSPVDGVTLSDGDRILLTGQTAPAENGIYDAVTAADPTTWTRSTDYTTPAEINTSYVAVREGTVNEAVLFVQNAVIATVGTSAITYVTIPYANDTLSNLGTTAVNANLDPASSGSSGLGSLSSEWASLYTRNVYGVESGAITGGLSYSSTGFTLLYTAAENVSGNTDRMSIYTGQNNVAGNTGLLSIDSGNATNGNSGNISIRTGTATGTRGNITLSANADDVLLAANPTTIGLQVATTQYVDDATAGGGTAIEKNQTTHGLALLDAIYHNGTIWTKAQADVEATLAEYVVTEVVDADNFVATKFGEAIATAHGLSVGEHYFLSDSVAGAGTTTEPSQYSSPLYYVEDANTLQIEVYRPSDVTPITSQTYYPTHVIPALEIDWAQSADTYFKAISVNSTFTWINDVNGQTIIVTVENTDVVDRDIDFPTTDVHWAGGTSTVTVEASSYSVVTFVRVGAIYMATAVNGLV